LCSYDRQLQHLLVAQRGIQHVVAHQELPLSMLVELVIIVRCIAVIVSQGGIAN
jgi:hypothetical protein